MPGRYLGNSRYNIFRPSAASLAHNDATGKQGGTGGEFYHLTQAIHDGLYSASPVIGLGQAGVGKTNIEVDYGGHEILNHVKGRLVQKMFVESGYYAQDIFKIQIGDIVNGQYLETEYDDYYTQGQTNLFGRLANLKATQSAALYVFDSGSYRNMIFATNSTMQMGNMFDIESPVFQIRKTSPSGPVVKAGEAWIAMPVQGSGGSISGSILGFQELDCSFGYRDKGRLFIQYDTYASGTGVLTYKATAAGGNEITVNTSGFMLKSGATVNNIETALTNDDTHIPTSGAVFDAIVNKTFLQISGEEEPIIFSLETGSNSAELDIEGTLALFIKDGWGEIRSKSGRVLEWESGGNISLGLQASSYIFLSDTLNKIDLLVSNVKELKLTTSGMALKSGATVNDIETTLTNDDTHIPTSGAVVDLIAAEVPVNITTGTGSPESVVTGIPGDIYFDTSGGAGLTMYVKETGIGNTGWAAK